MTEKEYNDLIEGNFIHYKDDNPSTNPQTYNWKIMHITHEGMMIDNENDIPIYMEKEEILENMEVSNIIKRPNPIEQYRLDIDVNDPDAWKGEITITLNRYELNLICKALGSAENEGRIDKSEEDALLDKLNIEHRY